MNIDEIKKYLQDFFNAGVVTIVGSGLSCAEGLPGMGELAKTLIKEIPKNIDESSLSSWENIERELKSGKGLEETLLKHPPTETIESLIISVTSKLIKDKEKEVLSKVISGEKVLKFSNFIHKLSIPNNGLPVITTNYDRLIEVACELQGVPIDNMFFGSTVSKLNEYQSRMSFCRDISRMSRKNVKLKYHRRIKIFKPHGCLSWYMYKGEPITSIFDLDLRNLIITPGLNKFRTGYEQPFDIHREKANQAIDNASRFIIIGYGFNDDHLETHLINQLQKGTPALIITRGLSENTQQIIKKFNNVISVSYYSNKDNLDSGTLFTYKGESFHLKNYNLWDLDHFVKEVLEV